MKVMILSDSHSMPKKELFKIMELQQADEYIHCGDIYMPFENLEKKHFYNVRGNNDRKPIPDHLTLEIDGLRFFIVHGHLYHVDHGIHELENYAKDHHIDVVCFGHTHQPFYLVKDQIIYINPGSVTYPRGTYRRPTYCLFDTQSKEVVFYDVKDQTRCDPFVKQEKESFSFFHLCKNKKQ